MNNQAEGKKKCVRFAPSPTGALHIGGARTALFNWLFVRKYGGEFLVRIEDTNIQKSSQENIDGILESLQWLGIDWDRDIWYQSQRLDNYRQYAERLVQDRKAYHCFCESPETQERDYKNDDRCSCHLLTVKEKNELLEQGNNPAVRFWIPDGMTVFKDDVYGSLEFNNAEIENFIILRSDKSPTYNLAVVVDDHDMGVTHVIRGDDHLSNTPKQILLNHAFGWDVPSYAHVPLILGTDKKRLSKRHGAASVLEYQNNGILPEALVNYLALMGWSPCNDQEIMDKDQLISKFSLDGISRKSAIFDPAKLEWVNSEHIKTQPTEGLVNLVMPFLSDANLMQYEELPEKKAYLLSVLDLFKTRMKKLGDLAKYGRYFFIDPDRYDNNALKKYWESNTKEYLSEFRVALEKLDNLKADEVENSLRELAAKMDIPAAKIIHPVRIVLTGFSVSPGLFEMMEVLGKETCLYRIDKGLATL